MWHVAPSCWNQSSSRFTSYSWCQKNSCWMFEYLSPLTVTALLSSFWERMGHVARCNSIYESLEDDFYQNDGPLNVCFANDRLISTLWLIEPCRYQDTNPVPYSLQRAFGNIQFLRTISNWCSPVWVMLGDIID